MFISTERSSQDGRSVSSRIPFCPDTVWSGYRLAPLPFSPPPFGSAAAWPAAGHVNGSCYSVALCTSAIIITGGSEGTKRIQDGKKAEPPDGKTIMKAGDKLTVFGEFKTICGTFQAKEQFFSTGEEKQ